MNLESMVVSRDFQEVSVLECILGSLKISVSVEPDTAKAKTRIAKSKLDAVIVDRDLLGSEQIVDSVLTSRNGNAVPLVLLSSSPERHDLPASGATYYFEKPISVEQAVRTLSAARNLILNGRLRYHRHALAIPVELSLARGRTFSAEIMNLSQGGMRIRAPREIAPAGPWKLRFKLPGVRAMIRATGELAWTDANGNAGVRFLNLAAHYQRFLKLWLERQYFAN
jgi:CheY-like chemotaxis protein